LPKFRHRASGRVSAREPTREMLVALREERGDLFGGRDVWIVVEVHQREPRQRAGEVAPLAETTDTVAISRPLPLNSDWKRAIDERSLSSSECPCRERFQR
jgi:hypothetical protein